MAAAPRARGSWAMRRRLRQRGGGRRPGRHPARPGDATVDLYGDSYGTYAAQVFALHHPGDVRAVVLDGAYDDSFDPFEPRGVGLAPPRVAGAVRAGRARARDPRARSRASDRALARASARRHRPRRRRLRRARPRDAGRCSPNWSRTPPTATRSFATCPARCTPTAAATARRCSGWRPRTLVRRRRGGPGASTRSATSRPCRATTTRRSGTTRAARRAPAGPLATVPSGRLRPDVFAPFPKRVWLRPRWTRTSSSMDASTGRAPRFPDPPFPAGPRPHDPRARRWTASSTRRRPWRTPAARRRTGPTRPRRGAQHRPRQRPWPTSRAARRASSAGSWPTLGAGSTRRAPRRMPAVEVAAVPAPARGGAAAQALDGDGSSAGRATGRRG